MKIRLICSYHYKYRTNIQRNIYHFPDLVTRADAGHIIIYRKVPQKSVFAMKLTLSLLLHRHIWQYRILCIENNIDGHQVGIVVKPP